MAFCTSCGATVNGTFCTQCGTPVSAAAAGAPQASPPPPPPPNMAYQAAPPAPLGPPPTVARRGTSPIVWVLVIVLGLFVLGGLAVVGVSYFVVHKVRQAGLDPDLMRRKPGLAITKMLTAMNPDVEVLDTDDAAGRITVRDRKSGKVTTLNFDDIRNGRMSITAEDENGKTATMQFGGSAGNLPSWIPAYPGAHPHVTMSARAAGGDGGNFTFTTSDSPAQVMQFYQDQIKSMGLKVTNVMSSSNGGMVNGSDDSSQRTLNVIVGTGSDGTTVAVTYGSK